MATLTTTNLAKILGAVFVVICLTLSATYADDNTSKSTQTTKAKSAQNGGGERQAQIQKVQAF